MRVGAVHQGRTVHVITQSCTAARIHIHAEGTDLLSLLLSTGSLSLCPWLNWQVLQDQAPTMPFSDVEKVFLHDFGRTPHDMFARFERAPLAAASLAQVSRARAEM